MEKIEHDPGQPVESLFNYPQFDGILSGVWCLQWQLGNQPDNLALPRRAGFRVDTRQLRLKSVNTHSKQLTDLSGRPNVSTFRQA
jgi:hypothetical protein